SCHAKAGDPLVTDLTLRREPANLQSAAKPLANPIRLMFGRRQPPKVPVRNSRSPFANQAAGLKLSLKKDDVRAPVSPNAILRLPIRSFPLVNIQVFRLKIQAVDAIDVAVSFRVRIRRQMLPSPAQDGACCRRRNDEFD